MAKGKRETAYHIIMAEKKKSLPFSIMEIPTAIEFKKWKQKVGLTLDTKLAHTGYLYGSLKNGQTCYIVKGKAVIPMDGVTI
jgi:hypothetical protein